MAKKKNAFKRILFIILFVVLLPVVLVALIVRAVSKKARHNLYLKNSVSGRKLIMSTNLDMLEKMETFEIDDFFKYLFFYQGFSTKKIDGLKNCLMLEKNERLFLMMYETRKNASHEKNVSLLFDEKTKKNIETGIYVTNAFIGDQFRQQSKNQNIDIIDNPSLEVLVGNVKRDLQLGIGSFGNDSDKSVDELLSEMYPNNI